jgi:signal transduction histidine kinase
MTLHEITPKQLRALLLLLVLVPFIPMVLMLRFMTDALHGERDAAWERLVSTNHRALLNAAATQEKHLATQTTPPDPAELRRFYRDVFESTIGIVIVDNQGHTFADPSPMKGKRIAQTTVQSRDGAWTVQIWLVDDGPLRDAVKEQFKVYAWTALIASVSICAIAAAAGLTVQRQLHLHELKNNAVATVAHELRTPLASMRMLVDTLRGGRYHNKEQLREYLDLLHNENLRLSRLTEHFLSHSRLAHGQYSFAFGPVPLRTVIDTAVNTIRDRLDAPGCVFTLDLVEPLPEMLADRDGLVTVFANLLENALKYTGDEKRITLHAHRGDGTAIVTVKDNGVGLTPAEQKHIFEPFYQVDRKLSRIREGSGLGLSIVHDIVKAHRGRIEVRSEPQNGTTFTVTLPLSPV